jgi:signal transduction histidine kinase
MFGFEFGKDFRIFDDFPMIKKFFNSDKREFSFIDTKNDKIYEARKVYLTKDRYIVVLRVATTSIFKKQAENYTKNLILVILLITFIITLMTTFLVSKLTSPIKKLTNIAKDIADSKGKKHIDIDVKSNDEIGELAKAFEVMVNTLDESRKEIEDFANKLEIEVEKKTKELQEVNKNLQKLVEEKVNEVRDKDKVLVQQSKMAAMGEMIGAIAHQWRQPLNSLALNIQLLEDMVEDGECTQENIEKFVDKNMQTIQFMSQTIDDFRNFFRKDKEAVEFNIKEAILKTINLQKAQLNNHNIEITTNLIDAYIKGYKNEFMQIILNLISNAKDAILERREKIGDFEGKIEVYNRVLDDKIIVGIKDNGGGIPDEIKERIFEPYFTTKEEGKGTGMGLYMVKEMVERMKGKIEFRNVDDGVEFIISFNR